MFAQLGVLRSSIADSLLNVFGSLHGPIVRGAARKAVADE